MYVVLLRRSETTSQPCLRRLSIKLPDEPTSELVGSDNSIIDLPLL